MYLLFMVKISLSCSLLHASMDHNVFEDLVIPLMVMKVELKQVL
jgi:hypothetical protein